jgi:uncharacterized lipoprotein YmbA
LAVIDLGKIKLTWRSTYNNSTAYVVDDVVAYTDTGVISTYICVANTTGNAPSSSGTAHASWQYMTKGVALSGSAHGDLPYYNGSSYVPLTAGSNGLFLKTQGSGAAPVWAALNEYDDTKVQNNIALLGFKVATTGSLSRYSLNDQVIDEFVDSSGIDAGNTSNAINSAGKLLSLSAQGNYWGTGADGAVTISGNTSLTVPNKNGSYDGDMVIKNYTNLTINSGQTLTTDQPGRGLMIFCTGNCTINGTLSMRFRGPFANPTTAGGSDNKVVNANGIQIGYLKTGSTESLPSVDLSGSGTAATGIQNEFPAGGTGHLFNVSRQGAAGAESVAGSSTQGNDAAAVSGSTGGGGSGGSHDSGNSGSGAYGNCWGGGSGGGGSRTGSATSAIAWGGAGGNAGSATGCGGGAGNPNGSNNSGATNSGEEGTGGAIWLFVKGNLTIGGSGEITAVGSQGNTGTEGGGGNSGSGAVLIGYGGTLSNSGSVSVASRSRNTSTNNGKGGQGAAGHTEMVQVLNTDEAAGNMDLRSVASTAATSPSKGDLVLLYSDQAGTATLNTDIKGFISRDNGSTYIEGTLVSEGTYGTSKIAAFHDKEFTGSAGTQIKYKVTTHNQVLTSKQTNIEAVSLGWA